MVPFHIKLKADKSEVPNIASPLNTTTKEDYDRVLKFSPRSPAQQ